MSLRLRGGRDPSGIDPEPPPGGTYSFPVNTIVYPILPTDGGTATAKGFIDVTDYGAVGDGVFNCTNAIQAAILANAETLQGSMNNWSKKTLFFPDGTYVVGGTGGLSGNTRGIIERKSAGSFNGGLRIQGESESGVIIRLADNSVDFQDADAPRYVIFQSNLQAASTPHNATDSTGLEGYHNYMADLTIDLGASNPGACGVSVMMHNIGAIRRVTVQDAVGMGRSTNEADRAFIGFDEWRQGAGPNLLSRLTVKGCEYGFRIGQTLNGQGMEHLKLDNQGTAGVLVDTNSLAIRGLYSTNDVPVALMPMGTSLNHFDSNDIPFRPGPYDHAGTWEYDNGTYPVLTIIDGTFLGTGTGAAAVSAVRNQTNGGKMFLRNIYTSGYLAAAQETTGVVQGGAALITEYASPPKHYLFGTGSGTEAVSLNLPIKNTPEPDYDDVSEWTSVTDLGVTISQGTVGPNQGPALQAAIDNCPTTTMYFPPTMNGKCAHATLAGNTLHFGRTSSPLRHIVGHGINLGGQPVGTTHTVSIEHSGTGLPVIIEGCHFDLFSGTSGSNPVNVALNTPRDVVLKGTTFARVSNSVTASNAGATLYMEDVMFGVIDFDFAQDVFARQWNAENENLIDHYVGGNLWCLYSKTEHAARLIDSTKFTGGNIEEIGGWHGLANQADEPGPVYMINNPGATLNSNLCIINTVEGAGGSPAGDWTTFVTEHQNGTTRTLVRAGNAFGTAMAPRGSHVHLTLYRSKM